MHGRTISTAVPRSRLYTQTAEQEQNNYHRTTHFHYMRARVRHLLLIFVLNARIESLCGF